jgi:peptide/nickel transport system substrate-binding protein
VVIRNYPPDVVYDTILPSGNFDLAETVYSNTLDPDDSANFSSRLTYPLGLNYGDYKNPVFDHLAGEELTTVDPAKRTALFWQMQQVLHTTVPAIWLYSPNDLAIAGTNVQNYQPSPFSQDTWNAWEWSISTPAAAKAPPAKRHH